MKYRKQKYRCCQLVAAMNARIFLGGEDVEEEVFEGLVDLVGCRYGSAISIEKCYIPLGLDYRSGPPELEWISKNLPVEFVINDPKHGLHSVLVIDVKKNKVSLVNCSKRKISWSKLRKWLVKNPQVRRCRSFQRK